MQTAYLSPREIALGDVMISGGRVISLAPAISQYDVVADEIGARWSKTDKLEAFKITVSGPPPKSHRAKVIGCSTTFSFETTVVPSNEPPWDCRFFFEHVEWRDASGGWVFGVERDPWDEFVMERTHDGFATIEFLGIARMVDGPSRDAQVRELFGQEGLPLSDQGPNLACFYKISEGG